MLPETHPLFDAEMFLLQWFEHAPRDHWIEFFAVENVGSMKKPNLPHTDCDACPVNALQATFDLSIASKLQKWDADGYGVYFGVCPRSKIARDAKGRPKRGTNEDVTIAVGAWVDIDKPHWKSHIEMEKPPATFVIATGHGCHLYFKYTEPKVIIDACADSKALADRYGGDHCYDPARVLRIPGTMNQKKKDDVVPCYLHDAVPDRFFDGIPRVEIPTTTPGGTDFTKIFQKIGTDAELRNCILGGHVAALTYFPTAVKEGTNEPDRSKIDFIVMKRCMSAGLDEGEIHAIMHNEAYPISEKVLHELSKQGSDNYFVVSVRNAGADVVAEKNGNDDVGEIAVFETPEQLCTAPALDFAVDRMLPVGGYCVLSGQAKAGKSLAATDLMLLMAGVQGKFLGHFNVNHHGAVGYAQAEITRSSLNTRLKTIGAGRGVVWEQYPLFVFTGRFNLMKGPHVDAVMRGLQKVKARYFVLDPLARFHYGNENQHGDMMQVLSNIERISRECGLLGTIVIHHHGKPGGDGGEKVGVQMMRGSTVIGDWGNAHVILQKQWTQTSGRKFIKVSMELRDAEEIPPLSLALDKNLRHLPFTEADERLSKVIDITKKTGLGDRGAAIDAVVETLQVRRSVAEKLVTKVVKMEEIKAGVTHDHDGDAMDDGVEPDEPESLDLVEADASIKDGFEAPVEG